MTLSIKNKNTLKLAIIFVFCAFFLGFNNGNVSAIENKSVSYPEGTTFTWNQSLFSDCSDYNCLNNYRYLIVNSSPKDNKYIGFRFVTDSNMVQDVRCYTDSCVFALPSGISLLGWRGESTSTPYDFNLTLTDTFGSAPPTGTLNVSENGTFNVTNYASVVVDVPQTITEVVEDPISNDFQKVFFKIVENIIPAFGILLVVWFGIDMLSSLIFGRGR